jgi:hypothetical protein
VQGGGFVADGVGLEPVAGGEEHRLGETTFAGRRVEGLDAGGRHGEGRARSSRSGGAVRRAERDQGDGGRSVMRARRGRRAIGAQEGGQSNQRLARANAGPSRRSRRRWTATNNAASQATDEAASLGKVTKERSADPVDRADDEGEAEHPDGRPEQLAAHAFQRHERRQERIDAAETSAGEGAGAGGGRRRS